MATLTAQDKALLAILVNPLASVRVHNGAEYIVQRIKKGTMTRLLARGLATTSPEDVKHIVISPAGREAFESGEYPPS